MRQAIEEEFILDVLENYTTYKSYWHLLKKIEDDPRYPKDKAKYLLRSFVDLHDHAIRKKVEIMVEHFQGQVAHRINGKAKAMIVCRSRLHAVRFKLALDQYLKEQGYGYRSLVAFSGTVRDEGADYTEAGMNGLPEAQTAKTFDRSEYRFLVVANKFQTGFDQPLLHTMYVDKKLGGVNAVQTLSRLNRTHPEKSETCVLDFANEADEIRKSFEPYYEKTILSESTDPNLLYDLENALLGFHVFVKPDIDSFAEIYFGDKPAQDKMYAALAPCVDRFRELAKEDQAEFRGKLNDFVRLYAFLSQVIAFTDPDLEKLYVFGKLLARYLPYDRDRLPMEIQQSIDMDSYRIQKTREGKIPLERGQKELPPITGGGHSVTPEELEALSRIIRELNDRFGTDFTEEDKVFIRQLEERLADDPALVASVRVNPPENARLAFDHVVTDRLQDMMDANFKFYKRVTDDRDFSKFFLDWLFERFREGLGKI
jgi:type I restriction enzyme R subunit